MKIGHIDNKIPVAPLNSERKAATTDSSSTAPAPAAAGAEPAALVELSATAAALSSADPEGSFDSAKVDRIRQSIGDGTYKVKEYKDRADEGIFLAALAIHNWRKNHGGK